MKTYNEWRDRKAAYGFAVARHRSALRLVLPVKVRPSIWRRALRLTVYGFASAAAVLALATVLHAVFGTVSP